MYIIRQISNANYYQNTKKNQIKEDHIKTEWSLS